MFRPVSRRAPLAILLCAALAGGCGEKDDPDPPSAAAAIAEGDEICAAASREISALRADAAPRTPQDAVDLTEKVLSAHEEEIAGLQALVVPDDHRPDLDRYLAARERGLEPLREGLDAARAGNPTAYARAQAEAAAGQVRRTELARAVGFSECSLPAAAGAPPPG
jgi:hypothetical protein